MLIIPPALFGKWKGHEETVEFCRIMNVKYGVSFHDFSMSVLEPKLYYDHHHLNTNGVEYFTEKFLKLALHDIDLARSYFNPN